MIGADPSSNRITDASRCLPGAPCITAQYDAAGHQTTGPDNAQYGYDAVDMMTALDTASRHEVYLYDAQDQRIATVVDATTAPTWRYTLRDGGANVIREWTTSGSGSTASWSWTKDHVHRDGVLLASIADVAGAEKRTHFHVDHLGSPRLLTDDEGRKVAVHTYWPFGLEAEGSDQDAETRKYTGHERDFAGAGGVNDLDYMHARYYGPGMGRFLSVDPVLDVKAALTSPQMWNRYSYAGDNPLNRVDPDGQIVQLVGTKEERKQAFAILKSTLREQDRQYVKMSSNGTISVDAKAQGGVAMLKLRDLASEKVPKITVELGTTVTGKVRPGPTPLVTQSLQAGGGGVAVPPELSASGNREVHVDPRGDLADGSPALAVMAHELMGHAWDMEFTGTTSEDTANTTENAILKDLGIQPVK